MKPFYFKEFTVAQDRCAMKVGTDGVLLGAWVSLENNPNSILDIGSGTGIIALQLAQRSNAETIDGLEIDENAYEQCVENYENSPWGDRLFCYHASLSEFALEIEEKYDLIISNPPFHSENYKTLNNQRNRARFSDALPFSTLLEGASKLLSKKGIFAVIIPYKEEQHFIETALRNNLFPKRICRVQGNQNSRIKRSLMEFTFEKNHSEEKNIIIEIDRNNYTEDYKKLVQDFYLKM